MSGENRKARTRHDLIIDVWEKLDCESVGELELDRIQQALSDRFGEGANQSPASIARILADEGAVLRHPEVSDCDASWREANLAAHIDGELRFVSLAEAVESLSKIEASRKRLQVGDEESLRRLRAVVVGARQDAMLRARAKIIEQLQRDEAKEISQWLTIWLQSPELFADWLELRLRSTEFRKKFGDDKKDNGD